MAPSFGLLHGPSLTARLFGTRTGSLAWLGIQFAGEVDRAIGLASDHPDRCPVMHKDIRCIRARRFPYSIFYIVESRQIVVLAIFHARRDPAIWRARA